jgi:hypothetical protein
MIISLDGMAWDRICIYIEAFGRCRLWAVGVRLLITLLIDYFTH